MEQRLRDIGRLLLAALLFAAFLALEETVIGRRITIGGSWANSSPGELYHWVGMTFLVLPSALLVGFTFAPDISRWLQQLASLAPVSDARVGAFATVGGLVSAVGFALGNRFVFKGLPFTDDETAARFGGELLADARVTTPAAAYIDLSPNLFLYLRDGVVTSFDWVGALLPWAFGELTGTGGLVFSLAAGSTVAAVGIAAWRLFGRGWGGVAALLFVASPMALTLSMTHHTHVMSRAWLAASFAVWFWGEDRGPKLGALAGALAGMAWVTRPVEVTALWVPLALLAIFRAWRDRSRVAGVAAFLGVGALFVALFVVHSYAVTDTLLPARLAGNNELVFPGAEHFSPPLAIFGDTDLLWSRFGANFGYNAMMLGIYGLGVLALPLAYLGVRDRTTGALAAGVAIAFGVALLHDDYGLHMVGPIHYSDAFVPFLLLVVAGLRRVHEEVSRLDVIVAIVVALCIYGATFSTMQLDAIERSARVHAEIYDVVDEQGDVILLVPPYYQVRDALTPPDVSAYVFDWRKDAVPEGPVIVRWRPNSRRLYGDLVDDYPDREVRRLRVAGDPPQIVVQTIPRRMILPQKTNHP